MLELLPLFENSLKKKNNPTLGSDTYTSLKNLLETYNQGLQADKRAPDPKQRLKQLFDITALLSNARANASDSYQTYLDSLARSIAHHITVILVGILKASIGLNSKTSSLSPEQFYSCYDWVETEGSTEDRKILLATCFQVPATLVAIKQKYPTWFFRGNNFRHEIFSNKKILFYEFHWLDSLVIPSNIDFNHVRTNPTIDHLNKAEQQIVQTFSDLMKERQHLIPLVHEEAQHIATRWGAMLEKNYECLLIRKIEILSLIKQDVNNPSFCLESDACDYLLLWSETIKKQCEGLLIKSIGKPGNTPILGEYTRDQVVACIEGVDSLRNSLEMIRNHALDQGEKIDSISAAHLTQYDRAAAEEKEKEKTERIEGSLIAVLISEVDTNLFDLSDDKFKDHIKTLQKILEALQYENTTSKSVVKVKQQIEFCLYTYFVNYMAASQQIAARKQIIAYQARFNTVDQIFFQHADALLKTRIQTLQAMRDDQGEIVLYGQQCKVYKSSAEELRQSLGILPELRRIKKTMRDLVLRNTLALDQKTIVEFKALARSLSENPIFSDLDCEQACIKRFKDNPHFSDIKVLLSLYVQVNRAKSTAQAVDQITLRSQVKENLQKDFEKTLLNSPFSWKSYFVNDHGKWLFFNSKGQRAQEEKSGNQEKIAVLKQ